MSMRGILRKSGQTCTILAELEKWGQPVYQVRFDSGLITTWRRDAIDLLPSDATDRVRTTRRNA